MARMTAVAPQLPFLEAIAADGSCCDFWCQLVQHQLKTGKSVGRSVARPPPAAVLGVGSFGQVWRARDTRSGMSLAVKSLQQDSAVNELAVMRHLRGFPHSCVVRFHGEEIFSDVSLVSLYLELCTGGDLLALVSATRKQFCGQYLAPPDAVKWLGQVLMALEHLHVVADVLHLDVKLGNVMLDARNHAKLADFGLARVGVAPQVSASEVPPGSPGYAAPEVLAGEPCSSEADLFSLGMMTWVLFTGGSREHEVPGPPVAAGTDVVSHRRLVHEVETMLKNADAAVGEFMLDLLCHKPSDRPSHDKLRHRSLLAGDVIQWEAAIVFSSMQQDIPVFVECN